MKAKRDLLAALAFLSVPLLSFIIDGILGQKIIHIVLLLVSIFFYNKHEHRYFWLFYILGIVLSLFQRNLNLSLIEDVAIILLLLFAGMLNKISDESAYTSYRIIIIFGIINAVAIMLQVVFNNSFNNLVFPFYTDFWEDYMRSYYSYGYYMGIQPVPGDAAGIIAFAIGCILAKLLSEKVRHDKLDIKKIILILALNIPMFFSGKKGVLICTFAIMVFLVLIIFGTRKQWIGFIFTLLVLYIAYQLIMNYIKNNVGDLYFYRINLFVTQIFEGRAFDTGRSRLYEKALSLWMEHPLFGIGWRKFREYTTSSMGYNSMHDVNFDYLQFLCETGIVGFGCIITPIIIMIRRTAKSLKHIIIKKVEEKIFLIILSSSFIQFFTVLYAFFEIPFYDRMLFFPIYMFSSICISTYYRKEKLGTRFQLRKRQ